MLDELRVRTIDGVWETVGRGALAGIAPVVTSVDADLHGPVALSATLTRDPTVEWPDLAAGTPLDYLRDGVKLWSGRIKGKPKRMDDDGYEVAIEAQGAQSYMDDDVHSRALAMGDLSEWVDVREWPEFDPAIFKPQGEVEIGRTIRLSWPNGTPVTTNDRCGVIIDLGEHARKALGSGMQLTVALKGIGAGSSAWNLEVYGVDLDVNGVVQGGISTGAARVDSFAVPAAGVTNTNTWTAQMSLGCRYIVMVIVRTGASGTTSSEAGCEIVSAQMTAGSAYRDGSGNGAVLASSVVALVPGLVPALDSSTVAIGASTFTMPDFASRALVTPRELVELANVTEFRQWYVDADKRVGYRAYPTAPLIETRGAFADEATDDVEAIYGRVLVEGQGVGGRPVIGQALTPTRYVESTTVGPYSDAGFEPAGVGSWTGLTLARSTTSPYAGTADGLVTVGTTDTFNYAARTLTGLVPGRIYAAQVAVQREHATGTGTFSVAVVNTALFDYTTGRGAALGRVILGSSTVAFPGVGAYQVVTVPFVAPPSGSADLVVGWLHATGFTAGNLFRVDELRILEPTSTSLDRLGVTRTLVVQPSIPLSQAVADQIAAVYAADLGRDQFKGSAVVAADSASYIVGGQPVRPAEMLLRYGDMIRLRDVREPTTGGLGRDGRIVAVSYSPADDVATVQIDNTTTRLDALLARVASIAQRRGVGGAT